MKIFIKKHSATTGTKIIVVESKSARTNKTSSFHPEYSKDRKNNLLIDKIPTRIVDGIEMVAL